MKICLFGVSGIALGKHNIKDPRLDQAHKLVEAQKKAYAQADVVDEKEMITSDAILTSRGALSDLLMKDLDAVETGLDGIEVLHQQVTESATAEKEMITSDAILTSRGALSDLLMKDLDAVETRLGRDPG